MAKATPKKAIKSTTKAARPGPRSAAAKPAKTIKAAAPIKKPAAAKAPIVSKDELRAQLAKAETTIATLRTKSREAVRAAKAGAAQIAALEAKVAQLEKKQPAQEKPVSPGPVAEKPAKRGRKAIARPDPDGSGEAPEPALAEPDLVAAD
jgi:hypothetical protein